MHTQRTERHITDHDDWCRACGGRGGEYEDNGYGSKIFEPCHICRGSGTRTVRVDHNPLPPGCM